MSKQKGFTLIELVVVIIILGILAATAIPRFTDLSADARNAAAAGVAGAIASGSSSNLAVRLARGTGSGPDVTGTAAEVCVKTTLERFVTGGVTLHPSGATGNDQFNIGALAGAPACAGAGTTTTCTVTAAGAGALPQNATVVCTG